MFESAYIFGLELHIKVFFRVKKGLIGLHLCVGNELLFCCLLITKAQVDMCKRIIIMAPIKLEQRFQDVLGCILCVHACVFGDGM